jgi:hypothetical protein
MQPRKQYGHISRKNQQGGQTWRWVLIVIVGLWRQVVFTWNSARVAGLFGCHPDPGAPLFQAYGYAFH